MKKTLLLAGVATCLFAMNANAMDLTPYVSAKVKYSIMNDTVKAEDLGDYDVDDNIFGGAIAIGLQKKLSSGALRAEIEYDRNGNASEKHPFMNLLTGNISDGKFTIKTQSIFLNGYYDINTNSPFTPYIGAGIGYTKGKINFKFEDISANEKDHSLSWQIAAGIGYAVNENVTLDAGWRYVDYGDFKDDGDKTEVKANEIYLGVRYSF